MSEESLRGVEVDHVPEFARVKSMSEEEAPTAIASVDVAGMLLLFEEKEGRGAESQMVVHERGVNSSPTCGPSRSGSVR